jgi:hypothetical protein
MTVPPPEFHGCSPLCDVCVDERFAQLGGVAQSRGERWARSVARVVPIDRLWPNTERMRAIALRKVRDLASDARLRELLTDEVVVGAARWWNRALEQAG